MTTIRLRGPAVTRPTLRLDQQDKDLLELLKDEHPGASINDLFRMLLSSGAGSAGGAASVTTIPATTMLDYRLPESHPMHRLFSEWMTVGPMDAMVALAQAELLTRRRFEVRSRQIKRGTAFVHEPDELEESLLVDPEDDDDLCGTCGRHFDDCSCEVG